MQGLYCQQHGLGFEKGRHAALKDLDSLLLFVVEKAQDSELDVRLFRV